MPFAGTDKIDPQISPMVQRQGAAGTPIFVKSVGAFLGVNDSLGDNVPSPASFDTNDTLFTYVVATGTIAGMDAANSTWTKFGMSGIDGIDVFRKQPDGDATDVFTIPANFVAVLAFTWCISNDEDKAMQNFQGGPSNTTGGNEWDVFVNNFGTGTAKTCTLVFSHRFRTVLSVPAPTVVPNVGSDRTLVGAGTFSHTSGGQNRVLWLSVQFQYQDPSAVTPAFEEGYTPDPTFAVQRTQQTRWSLV